MLGEDLKKYAAAGIETDHECTTLEEGRQRANLGMARHQLSQIEKELVV